MARARTLKESSIPILTQEQMRKKKKSSKKVHKCRGRFGKNTAGKSHAEIAWTFAKTHRKKQKMVLYERERASAVDVSVMQDNNLL